MKIKICGLTNREDMEMVARMGADYGGLLIEVAQSPHAHSLTAAQALSENPPLPLVAVTLDRNIEDNLRIAETLSPTALQLHGMEPPEIVFSLKQHLPCEIWKVIHLPARMSDEVLDLDSVPAQQRQYREAGADRLLVDATVIARGQRHFGGTGQTVDWKAARYLREQFNLPLLLAGGITPHNVVEALSAVQPYGIDLSSGVEIVKGKKDPDLVLTLITRVREYEFRMGSGITNSRVC